MIGRLAPGAKVEPVIPGLYCRESARFCPSVAAISREGTTVRATNWSSARMGSLAGGGCVPAAGACAWAGGGGRDTGLGVVTTMPGSCVCASAVAPARQAPRTAPVATPTTCNDQREPSYIAVPRYVIL